MTSIKLIVSGASARAEVDGLLTSGMVGIPVTIVCDGAWDGLTKHMVCRAGHIVKTILNVGNTETVAHECMVPNQTLFIGIEGRNADGTLVIPTVWARCGLIYSGANAEADPSTDPTLPVWAQVQSMIGNLDDLNTRAKENLVAAINEALTQGGGEVDPEAVQQIVEDYLAANPPTVTETDPTVPGWAKKPEKPTYTAAEVGALPDTYKPPVDTTLTQSGKAADAAAVGNRLSALSEEKVSLPKDNTGATQNGTNGQILQTNGDGTTQWVDKHTGGSSGEIANLTAYDAGAVKPFLRYDTFWDVVNPMFVTKHMNELAANNSVEIINDGATVHEVVGVLSPDNRRVYITYLKNIDGTTGDTGDTSESGRCKVYFKGAYNYYGPTNFKPTISTNEIELFAKGQELVDGTTIDTGGPACPTLYSDGSTLFAACLFAGNGCGGYVRTADISENPAPEDVVWSTAQPWTLSIDDIVGKFDMNRLNGWTDATWQTNNQIVWEPSINMFIMAVCVNKKAIVLVKSSDGINWKYVNTIYTDYLCKFQCEAAVFRHANSRIWIAVRNGNTAISTSKLACGNKNYLTIFKVSGTGEKLEEYNIPDTGVKPWFIPVPSATKKGAYLLHNAQSRYSIQVEYIDEYYPGMTLGEMYGVGTNYCCGVTKSSSALDVPIMLMGTNGLVTEKAGASLVYNIRLGQYLDVSKSLGLVKKLITADVDTEVTLDSPNLVTSGAVFNAIKNFDVPVATSNSVGVVKPVEKTAEMTQSVGIDETGALFVEPSSGGESATWALLETKTINNGDSSCKIEFPKSYNHIMLSGRITAATNAVLHVIANVEHNNYANTRLASISNGINTNGSNQFLLTIEKIADKAFKTSFIAPSEGSTGSNTLTNALCGSGVTDISFLYLMSGTTGQTFTSGDIKVYVK